MTVYDACSQVLGRETELLCDIEAAQKRVWDAVVKREWADFEALMAGMGKIGAELGRLEDERTGLVRELAADSGGGGDDFYGMAALLPARERHELMEKYRGLKMAGLRVRTANESLVAYMAGIKTTMAGFIEAAFPDRKGRVYSRSGAVVPQDMRSMVLNRRL
jgi:hypothetical protein